jgi:hypothetical protein
MEARACIREGILRLTQQDDQGSTGLQSAPQHLHHLPDRLLIPSIPSPLSMLGSFDEPSLGQNRHMMRNGGLRKMNSLLDVAAAQARRVNMLGSRRFARRAFF